MIKRFRIIFIAIIFIALVLIRAYESVLFYDPFIAYYKTTYFLSDIPNYNLAKITINTVFRYSINSILSITILYIAFNKRDVLRFSTLLYISLFILLIILYQIILLNLSNELKQMFFYVRRFLIQPIFILILLPAFYYQQKIKK
jgi:exosortase F-associated protein